MGIVYEEETKDGDDNNVTRERFSSRIAFYFAAVGSAVGFGNVWRFPALMAEFGGGAFFIPYLLALFLIGIPVLFLEIGLGQYHQTGDVGVFGSFSPRLRGVGLSSLACGFVLVTYYSMLIAWVLNAFFDSFSDSAPWTNEGVNGTVAIGYFYNDIIGMETLGSDLRPTRMVWTNVGYATLGWFIIFICLAWGMKWTGRITYTTMGLPVILIFVFLGKACTLTGASDGVNAYIGDWDLSVLTERGDCWSRAVSQIFFSLSVTFGTMTAYGSHCPRDEPAFLNSAVIAASNTLFSFTAGFAVFAALGHLAYVAGDNVSIDDLSFESFSLVFGTWPVVLGTLKGGEHWVRLLFFTLFLLGIDSAFSITEGLLTVTRDTILFRNVKRWLMTLVICIVAYFFSWIYATDAGLIFLDTIDYYINFMLLLVGAFETISAGWVYGIKSQAEIIGWAPIASFMFANFGAVFVASGCWFGIEDRDAALISGFVSFAGIYLVFTIVACALLSKKVGQPINEESDETWTWLSLIQVLVFKNVMDLKAELQIVIGWVPDIWCMLIRHFIPQVLLILFISLATTTNDDGKPVFGHYEGYVTWPYQVLGILCVAWAATLFLLGLAYPRAYAQFALYEGSGTKVSNEKSTEIGVKNIEDSDQEEVEEEETNIKVEEGEIETTSNDIQNSQ